ncbi:hypothetical protein [Streptomyces sirii]|uniref:hypothetical protein n=1 Tax=Streptomyces sirii TaxID=3127701 RepID=UPI003D36F93A
MSALATEAPAAPLWVGRLVVRAAGQPLLHIGTEGAMAPAAPMFTVPLECCPDAEFAPGVRPWTGPVNVDRLCAACLRALRSELAPEPARLVAAGTVETLPEQDLDRQGRRLWAVPDLPSYSAPSLPAEHGGQPILWSEWIEAPKLSHYSSACAWCGDAGPCVMAGGRQGNPLSKGKLLRWFVAYRCAYCQEMRVYERAGAADLKPIAYFKPKSPKGARV